MDINLVQENIKYALDEHHYAIATVQNMGDQLGESVSRMSRV